MKLLLHIIRLFLEEKLLTNKMFEKEINYYENIG